MQNIIGGLTKQLKGDVTTDLAERQALSHDASIYELVPDVVIAPKDASDIQHIVSFVNKYKSSYPKLSITPRSAGTDMSGAAIGSSLLLEMTPYFNAIESLEGNLLHVQPGVFIRDIDPVINAKGLQLGSVPASRAICTIGGMVGNNAGGEQSLRFGNTEHWVREMKVVLADGNEYTVKPLTKKQLDKKMSEKTFEGNLYKRVYELIESNYDLVHNARPKSESLLL